MLATSAQTGGALFAVEIRMPPGGGPPVMHRHAPGEVYYVLEGEFTFYVGDPDARVRRITAAAGTSCRSPAAHPTRSATSRRRRGRLRRARAGRADGGLLPRARPRWPPRRRPSMEAVLAIAAQHGIELLGPIPEPAVSA